MTILRTGALITLLAVALFAKPNFTGDWKLNASKSEFGQMPPPTTITIKIAHDDPTIKSVLKVNSDQGDFDWQGTYTTDGKESVNDFNGTPSKSIAKWQGDDLLLDTKTKFQDTDVTINDKWTLSPDGKTFTLNRKFSSSMGEMEQKLVFDKAEKK